MNLLIEEKTEQCTLSADHEQNEKKLLCSIRACLTGDISMSKQQKSPAWHAEQVGNSPKLLLKLYHECLKI
ncbi:Orf12 [Lactococcus phage bIL285]|uniref:Orf12 n=1 Tax=Lactococcus phage bIL285 TaxID=151535 RepID=UPI000009BB67|nr:Orf12 [Lactococcus phage bIL285]AAK08237.1 Orf12 [Lactococcus phage bIL285]